jgi:hypothetical protein
VAVTVREAGLPAIMSPAIAERQALAAQQGKLLAKAALNGNDLDAMLDGLLEQRSIAPRAAE